MGEMLGKVAFVTGGASGIGRASAQALAGAGAKVLIMDLDQTGLAETVALIEQQGGTAALSVGDVTVRSDVDRAVQVAIDQFGALHLAHNNAGIVGPGCALADFPLDQFRTVLDVNVIGVLNCMQAQIPHMLAAGGGAIVNTASVVGRTGMANISAYVTSKHAVVGLTKTAALEYAAQGIRINCISPGYVITNMTETFFTQEHRDAFTAAHPIGRGSSPEEIANAALWVLSDKASYLVGADIAVDGGYTIP